MPQLEPGTDLSGDTRFVGLACDAAPAPAPNGATIAVIEPGVCDFTVKVQLVEAAGFEGAIVFNRTGEDGCETHRVDARRSGDCGRYSSQAGITINIGCAFASTDATPEAASCATVNMAAKASVRLRPRRAVR